MSTDSVSRARDISVLQLLTRLVVETERIIRLADDINQHATTPQAKSALSLIGQEVGGMLGNIKSSIEPLYKLYDIDPGLKTVRSQLSADHPAVANPEYDENALWTDVKKQSP